MNVVEHDRVKWIELFEVATIAAHEASPMTRVAKGEALVDE